ncbi:MAG: class I SAM-dependent methyltransferase, partial [Acidimicrobiales bacterium]
PQPVGDHRRPQQAVAEAEAAGLTVVDLREATLTVEFFDIGAVIFFLRKVVWTVPGFTVAAYRDRLLALHEHIRRPGRFVCHARRLLIEVTKPAV